MFKKTLRLRRLASAMLFILKNKGMYQRLSVILVIKLMTYLFMKLNYQIPHLSNLVDCCRKVLNPVKSTLLVRSILLVIKIVSMLRKLL